jgi:amino acid transporter
MAWLLGLANVLNRPDPAFAEAQSLLEQEDSPIGRVIRRAKMNGSTPLEPQERELPRWVQVPVGLVLGMFTLLCGFASLSLLLVPNKQSPALAIAAGVVLLLGCLWVLEKCFRLLAGRKRKGGLMTPNTLRVVSFFMLLLPIAGLFTGYYREMGAVAIVQAVVYFFAFLGLRAFAQKREAKESQTGANECSTTNRQ